MDADADAQHRFISSTTFNDELSSEFFGFRGQLALGLEQALTDSVSFGVIGRLDYWSDFPSIEWPTSSSDPSDLNSIAEEDFLALSVGVRLSINLGGAPAAP